MSGPAEISQPLSRRLAADSSSPLRFQALTAQAGVTVRLVRSWLQELLGPGLMRKVAPQVGRDRKLLVINPSRQAGDSLAQWLRNHGFEVCVENSSPRAVARARDMAPDLIISELLILGGSGIDAVVKIREFLPGCKVLLLSGQSLNAERLAMARTRILECLKQITKERENRPWIRWMSATSAS